ncbi:MAG TPA: hypothetical protein VGF74_15385, partial [Thermoleophilaceae bacterium]
MLWDIDEYTDAAGKAIERLAAYVDASQRGSEPVIAQPPIEEIAATLDQRALIRGGGMDGERFAAFLDAYLERTTRLHHPGSL